MTDISAKAGEGIGGIAVSSLPGHVTLYDKATAARIGTLPGPASPVKGAALSFSQQGQLAAISGDTVVVWNLSADDHVRLACRIANRTFTASERRTYLTDGYDDLTPCA